MHINKELAQVLIPLLQHFVATGRLPIEPENGEESCAEFDWPEGFQPKVIEVTYQTQVPGFLTDQDIQAHLVYALSERGSLPPNHPLDGCGPEPYEETIRFRHVNSNTEETTQL